MSDTTGDPRDAYALARAVLEASSDTLQSLLAAVPADLAGERPIKEEWSGLEVMGHLLTVEALLRHRVGAIVAGNGGPIARLDIPHQPTPPSLPVALAAWRDRRQQNLAWLAGLDLEHLRQLMALLEHRLHPGMGPFRAVYRRPFETAESPKS